MSSPRLNLRYDLMPDTKLLLAWGDYHQFQAAEAMQVEDGVDRFFAATRAEHRIVGFEHRFATDIGLRADVYQKRYRRLRPRFTNLFDGYEPIPEAEPHRYRVDADSADARGFEISLKHRATEGFSWRASYTYSSAEDRIDGLDVSREWDQPHALSAVLNWQGSHWNFNVAAAWRSGWPRTNAELAIVDTPGGPQPGVVPGRRNSDRYEDYRRVDSRISRNVNLERGTFTYFFEVYNIFDTVNPCCIDELGIFPGPSLQVGEENWLPRMPSFGFTWTFH